MKAPVDLEAIQARIDAATEGPWTVEVDVDPRTGGGADFIHSHSAGTVVAYSNDRGADDEFIAHARTDIVDMADEIRELRSKDAHHANLTSYLEDEVRALRALLPAQMNRQPPRPSFKHTGRLRLRLPADHRNHVHFAIPTRTVYIEAWGQHVPADPFPPASGVELQRAFDRIQQIHRQTMKDYL